MSDVEEPKAKRKKCISLKEALDKLKDSENNVSKACEAIVEDISPFDVNDQEVILIEDRIERLQKVSVSLQTKLYKLVRDVKARKFRHQPQLLEEKFTSCSQHSVLQCEDSQDLCDSLSQTSLYKPDENDEDVETPVRPSTYTKRSLNTQMSQKTRRRRVAEKRVIFSEWAEEEGVKVSELHGYLLHLENWTEERNLAAVGWKIFMGESLIVKPEVTIEESIWLIERSGMSQTVYLEVRLRLQDRIYLPPVMHVRAENQRNRPDLVEYRHGMKASLPQCLSLTLTERVTHMDLSALDQDSLRIVFLMGWGLDGSGEQKDYKQLSKVSYTTKQVMLVCFALKQVKVTDDEGNEVCWNSSTAGANKPQNTRPLAVFPSKETTELLEDFVPLVEAEIKDIKMEGVNMSVNGMEAKAVCQDCNMSMIDGKMVNKLLNCDGAYCSMCTYSLDDCHKSEIIERGFLINRSLESNKDIALSLMDVDSGEVIRKKADYATRQGVCGLPITETDLTKNIPVCHTKIRSFEWIRDVLVRERSHRKWSCPTNIVRYTKEEKELYKASYEDLKQKIYENLAINIGNPGDMVTGKQGCLFFIKLLFFSRPTPIGGP